MDLTTQPPRPAGQLIRIGDAERQAAAAELQQHFAAGRLTWEELDERLGLAWSARTGGDLAGLFGDLPALASPKPATRRRSRRRVHVDLRFVVMLLVAVALIAATRGFILLPVAWWLFAGRGHHHRRHDSHRHGYYSSADARGAGS